MPFVSRREFLRSTAAAGAIGLAAERPAAQGPGDRPQQAPQVTVLNPGMRVPVGRGAGDERRDQGDQHEHASPESPIARRQPEHDQHRPEEQMQCDLGAPPDGVPDRQAP